MGTYPHPDGCFLSYINGCFNSVRTYAAGNMCHGRRLSFPWLTV